VYRRRKAEERLHLVLGLLVAILDIDEVIAVIRSSDDAAAARERLQAVFDLSELQATYILDMPLRRLTKFSRIELEQERDTLEATIAELTAILEDEKRLRRLVSDELADVAKRFGLLDGPCSSSQPVSRSPRRCRSRSRTTRAGSCCPPPACSRARRRRAARPDGPRAKHDVIVSAVRSTARGSVGVVTDGGGWLACRCSACRRYPSPQQPRTSPAELPSRSSSSSRASGCLPWCRWTRTDPASRSAPSAAW
jgi:DNA gyrase subunit A